MLVKSKEEPVYSLQSLLFDERITQLPLLQSRYTLSMEVEDILAAEHTVPPYNRIPALLYSALAAAERQRQHTVWCDGVWLQAKHEAFATAVSTLVRHWNEVGDGQDSATKESKQ